MSPTVKPLTSADLEHFIEARGVAAEILRLPHHTPTVDDAARALGVDPVQIVKSLVFMRDDAPVLVITNGPARVDRRRLAAALGVGRQRARFATPEQALAITGYVVGSMPPFGHRRPLTTLVDPGVAAQPLVYGGGGDVNAMMRLTPAELLRVTGGVLEALVEPPPA
jgi:prolyl-tRNA editing enzyme YbaK/EbsC (Cys-tRNA(Pro) deacylase)